MKTDVQIAQEAKMLPISEIAGSLGITEDELDLYGKYKAKVSLDVLERLEDKPDGKLILVTAINPTPAGEGKTTVTVGLGQALNKLGKKAVIALREPSLGPVFGIKGGAAGGAAVNLIFINHFQDMARGHFTVRRLERKYGEEMIRSEYERIRQNGEK